MHAFGPDPETEKAKRPACREIVAACRFGRVGSEFQISQQGGLESDRRAFDPPLGRLSEELPRSRGPTLVWRRVV